MRRPTIAIAIVFLVLGSVGSSGNAPRPSVSEQPGSESGGATSGPPVGLPRPGTEVEFLDEDTGGGPGPLEESSVVGPIPFVILPGPSGPVPFETIDKGYVSYHLYIDRPWAGSCLAIRDGDTWEAFWDVHTSGMWPQPDPPVVDFSREIVLGCIQGVYPDCCQTYAEIVAVDGTVSGYVVSVVRHYEPGMLDMVTNPFHVVSVPRTEGDVSFFDANTGERIPEIPPVP